MQALAERLDALLADRTLRSVEVLQFSALKTVSPAPEELRGSTLRSVTAVGKYLVFDLVGPRVLVHLSQGGRVTVEDPPKQTRPRRGVARLRFDAAPAVLLTEFGTERRAALWVMSEDDPGPLADLGLDPRTEAFAELVRTSDDRRNLHSLLHDQRTVAGIGRGYAGLEAGARERLTDAVRSVLEEGLEVERRRTGGLPAKLGDHWIVHARHGEPCTRCGETLRRVSFEAYEITYCPDCQTGGRVLKDRRLSRLLR